MMGDEKDRRTSSTSRGLASCLRGERDELTEGKLVFKIIYFT